MSLLLVVILLVAGWFALDAGFTFIAFLLFLIATINALTSGGKASAGGGPAPGQRPVIVTTTGGELPSVMKIGIKSHWHGTDSMEDFATTGGQILNIPFAILARVMGLKIKLPSKEKGH